VPAAGDATVAPATGAAAEATPPPRATPLPRAVDPDPFVTPNQAMVVLAYLWLFCIVPLLAERNDRVVRWHALHGLVLVIAEIVASLAILFTLTILRVVLPVGLVALVGELVPVLWIAVVLLHGVLLVDALAGRRWRVPIITGYAERLYEQELAVVDA
jgi:uncharacterized membrane protein